MTDAERIDRIQAAIRKRENEKRKIRRQEELFDRFWSALGMSAFALFLGVSAAIGFCMGLGFWGMPL